MVVLLVREEQVCRARTRPSPSPTGTIILLSVVVPEDITPSTSLEQERLVSVLLQVDTTPANSNNRLLTTPATTRTRTMAPHRCIMEVNNCRRPLLTVRRSLKAVRVFRTLILRVLGLVVVQVRVQVRLVVDVRSLVRRLLQARCILQDGPDCLKCNLELDHFSFDSLFLVRLTYECFSISAIVCDAHIVSLCSICYMEVLHL